MPADRVLVEFYLSLALMGAASSVWASPPSEVGSGPIGALGSGASSMVEGDRRADIRRALHARDERYLRVESGQVYERRRMTIEERRAFRVDMGAAARDAYGNSRSSRGRGRSEEPEEPED